MNEESKKEKSQYYRTGNTAVAKDVTADVNNRQYSKYRTGKNGSTGHGFLAEDVNAQTDYYLGNHVEKTGVDNSKNGPDRIVNQKAAIQTKYYKTARQSVNAAFDKSTGLYKYRTKFGRPQHLEIPPEQYEEALNILKQKISEGKVPGIKNPEYATKILKKGHISWENAFEAAKTGKIEGVVADIYNGGLTCASAGGISGIITFWNAKQEGKSNKQAAKAALKSGVATTGLTALTTAATGQVNRVASEKVVKEGVNKMVNAVAEQGGKHFSKRATSIALKNAAKSNIVTGGITLAVTSIPDVYHACKGDISKSKCAENIAVNAGGIAAGFAVAESSMAAGATVGAAVGSVVPVAGNAVGAVVGGAIGLALGTGAAIAGSAATKKTIGVVKSFFSRKKRR